jgi:hypothetical protein
MYDPAHILSYHFAPVAVTAALGALLGRLMLAPARGRGEPK